MKNVLFLGNGFSRKVFSGMPSWQNLFKNIPSSIKNYTILYETSLLSDTVVDEAKTKKTLIEKIRETISLKNIDDSIQGLNLFGKKLKENNISDIITTNYDQGLDLILCEKCGYTKVEDSSAHKETIYSIRTYSEYENKELQHKIKIWKIHGELDRVKSIMLGYDQYCGLLAKLSEYIKGTYRSNSGVTCKRSIVEKCKENSFDGISWAELFFNANIYIVGFGMDFSEIDIWWLLNKRARVKKALPVINNRIRYLYSNEFDNRSEKKETLEALGAFNVESKGINYDNHFIDNIFNEVVISRSFSDLSRI